MIDREAQRLTFYNAISQTLYDHGAGDHLHAQQRAQYRRDLAWAMFDALHPRPGWLDRECPTCKADPGSRCVTLWLRTPTTPHQARRATPTEATST